MPTAFAEQLSPEEIEPMIEGSTFISCAHLLNMVEQGFIYDRFMGIVRHDLPLRGNRYLAFGFIVCDFGFQVD